MDSQSRAVAGASPIYTASFFFQFIPHTHCWLAPCFWRLQPVYFEQSDSLKCWLQPFKMLTLIPANNTKPFHSHRRIGGKQAKDQVCIFWLNYLCILGHCSDFELYLLSLLTISLGVLKNYHLCFAFVTQKSEKGLVHLFPYLYKYNDVEFICSLQLSVHSLYLFAAF